MKVSRVASVLLAAGPLALVGCASMEPDIEALRAQLSEEQEAASEMRSSLSSMQSELREKAMLVDSRELRLSEVERELQQAKMGEGSLLPPGAKTGECYARVFIPPTYERVAKTVLRREAAEKVAVTNPTYDMAEERVLVREASTKLTVIPARYDWVEERVLVKEASEKIVVEPAVYDTTTERVLVRPAYTTWKKGRGPIERIDQATGEIMCLVEVPAEYKTITKQVLVRPATTRRVALPAEYQAVRKRVMVEAPRTETMEVPAEYKTVKVRKLASPAKEVRIPGTADYQEVVETKLVAEGRLEWQPILCETNTTPQVVSRLQRALDGRGYSPGPIDGVVGRQTLAAVSRYQKSEGLASGKLTIETLKKLGVM